LSGGQDYGCTSEGLESRSCGGIIKNLNRRRIEGSYANTAEKAKEEILAATPVGASVFRCGPMTAVGMGLWEDKAQLPGVEVLDPSFFKVALN
jgi:hypothetical protein